MLVSVITVYMSFAIDRTDTLISEFSQRSSQESNYSSPWRVSAARNGNILMLSFNKGTDHLEIEFDLVSKLFSATSNVKSMSDNINIWQQPVNQNDGRKIYIPRSNTKQKFDRTPMDTLMILGRDGFAGIYVDNKMDLSGILSAAAAAVSLDPTKTR
jgi:hypothetical protein